MKYLKKLSDAIGRRGALLITLGFFQVMLGIATIAAPSERADSFVLVSLIGTQALGIAQIILGTVAATSAFLDTGKDRYGFIALYLAPLLFSVDYLTSAVLGNLPGGAGIRGGLIWLGYVAIILVVSGMQGIREAQRGRGGDGPN